MKIKSNVTVILSFVLIMGFYLPVNSQMKKKTDNLGNTLKSYKTKEVVINPFSKDKTAIKVKLANDEILVVSGYSNPSTGYCWQVKGMDNKVLKLHEIPVPDAIEPVSAPGASTNQRLCFSGIGKGTTKIELEYLRPWKKEKGSLSSHVIEVESDGGYTGSFKFQPVAQKSVKKLEEKDYKVPGLPSYFDWYDTGDVTDVKDQGSCGSCWAFGATAQFESAVLIKDGGNPDFSEQFLVSCASEFDGCGGGWWSHPYFINKVASGDNDAGAVYEEDDYYSGTDEYCYAPYPHHEKANAWGYTDGVADSNIPIYDHWPSIAQVKQAIYTYGPVGTVVCCADWSSYTGGVLTSGCTADDHIVLITGWDDANYCYFIKNSWGSSWGEGGYIRVSYGVSMSGYLSVWLNYNNTLTANFIANNTNVLPGESVTFTDLSSSPGTITSWQWSFPGGTPSSYSGKTPPAIKYNTIGNYSVTLTVSDNQGGTIATTKSNYISVANNVMMRNGSVSVGDNFNFYDSGGSANDYQNNESYTLTLNPNQAGSKVKLTFQAFEMEYDDYSCQYDVMVIYNGTSTSSPVIGTYCNTTSPGTVEATNTAGALTIKFTSDDNTSASGWVAKINLITPADTQAPSVPTGLVASNVTQTSLTLNWTASTDNVGVTGYDVYRGTTLAGNSTTTSFNATGLTANTTYSFTVKAKDAAGNVSAASAALSVTTTPDGGTAYCASQGTNNTREYIRIVKFGTFSNTTGASGYSDYTNMTISMAPGAVSYTLTPKFVSGSRTEYWRVWIDFNKNGLFTDTGEQMIAISSAGSRTGTITIPTTATGTTRMRVSMKYSAAPTSCEVFTYGEVEDYTVSFGGSTDTQAPSVPTGLASSNVTQNSCTIRWSASTDNVGVTGYDVYRGTTLAGSPTTTSLNVTGLTANTTYSFTVRAKDAAGNVSAASAALSVTTTGSTVTYCASKSNDYTYEWIAGVQIGSFSKTSTGAFYSDFTSSVINLTPGANTSLVVTPGFRPNEPYNEVWRIWIDYNKNGVFTDAGEQVYAGSGKTALSGSFNVPSGLTGTTRMRVSMKYGSAPTSCETFAEGEVEDYTVSFGAAGPGSTLSSAQELIIRALPNPNGGSFRVVLSGVTGKVTVSVFSGSGQLVFQKTVQPSGSSVELPVDLKVAPGVYTVKAVSDSAVATQKVIVK